MAGYGTPQNNLHPEGGPRHPERSYKMHRKNNRMLFFCMNSICVSLFHYWGQRYLFFELNKDFG